MPQAKKETASAPTAGKAAGTKTTAAKSEAPKAASKAAGGSSKAGERFGVSVPTNSRAPIPPHRDNAEAANPVVCPVCQYLFDSTNPQIAGKGHA